LLGTPHVYKAEEAQPVFCPHEFESAGGGGDSSSPVGDWVRLSSRSMASLFGNGGYSYSSGSEGEDEDEGTEGYRKGGYHAARPGDRFAGGRFVAQRKIGWGNFSTVWLAYDTLHSVRP